MPSRESRTHVLKFLARTLSPIFSSPGRSPGRAIVLPPASALAAALAKSLTLKFLCDGQGAVRRAILSL